MGQLHKVQIFSSEDSLIQEPLLKKIGAYSLEAVFCEEIGDNDFITMVGAEYKTLLSNLERQQEEITALEFRIKTLMES